MRDSFSPFLIALLTAAGCDASASSAPDADVADANIADANVEPCAAPSTSAPSDVFCIGLYDGHSANRHAESAHPYTPGVVLWSDGAEKQRYLYLPPSTQIDTTEMDAWQFPIGTKAFKEFRLDGKLIETRLLWKQAEHNWVAATYIWNDEETEAPLNESRAPVLLDSGYEIPTARDCGKCHHGGSDKLLGIEAVALGLPDARGETLEKLVADGRLSAPPPTTSITIAEDDTGKAAAALGYLHVNCGMPCHSSRGLGDETQLLLRLRAQDFWAPEVSSVSMTDAYTASVDQEPTTASVAQQFPGALRITPGEHDKSLLWLLSHRRGLYQMPPLVSHRVDEVGTQQLADWIDALHP